MEALTLLRDNLRSAHELLEATMADVTPEQAPWLPPGTANPVGATYAHVLIAEDALVNAVLRGGRPLFASTWDDRVGVSECMPLPPPRWQDFSGPAWEEYGPWARRVRISLRLLRRYALAVYAASDDYLVSLRPDDLSRSVDLSGSGLGRVSLGWIVSRLGVGRVDNGAGEIACLKGLQVEAVQA